MVDKQVQDHSFDSGSKHEDITRVGQSLTLTDDFSNTNLKFGDYIRLRGLKRGDLIYLKDKGSGVKTVLVGNSTPYEGVSNTSEDGWDWNLYNLYEVWLVYRLELEKDGSWLEPCHRLNLPL